MNLDHSAIRSMNSLRCAGLLILLLLSGCDADKQAPPTPKVAPKEVAAVPSVAAPSVVAPAEKKAEVLEAVKPAAPVHDLPPSVAVVPVVATGKAQPVEPIKAVPAQGTAAKASSTNAKSSKVKEDNAEIARRAPVASKTKAPAQVVKDTRLPKPDLDLSLPPDMVKQLTPPSSVVTAKMAAHPKPKPILPKMFPDTQSDPDFQLNGRLLSNEMQLQLRNEARRDVEGAAVDFTFKQ